MKPIWSMKWENSWAIIWKIEGPMAQFTITYVSVGQVELVVLLLYTLDQIVTIMVDFSLKYITLQIKQTNAGWCICVFVVMAYM